MTDYTNSSRLPVRAIRWRCPGCGAMGDTVVKTNRRCTIVRRWCDDPDCRPASEVRDALRAEAIRRGRKAAQPIDFSQGQTGRWSSRGGGTVRLLPLLKGDTNAHKTMADFQRHWIRPGLDFGPIERRILARMRGKS